MMFKPTIEQIKAAMLKRGYTINNGDKPYHLNIVGIRNPNSTPNTFDDFLVIFFNDVNKKERVHYLEATTDPGTYWLENPEHIEGGEHATLIMAPGQYKNAYQVGLHGRSHPDGGYKALEQVGPITYIKDINKDNTLDFQLMNNPKSIVNGVFKTNIHRANEHFKSVQVDKWSAGCQVIADPVDFELLMMLCDHAEENYGNKFNYTLLHQPDFQS